MSENFYTTLKGINVTVIYYLQILSEHRYYFVCIYSIKFDVRSRVQCFF